MTSPGAGYGLSKRWTSHACVFCASPTPFGLMHVSEPQFRPLLHSALLTGARYGDSSGQRMANLTL